MRVWHWRNGLLNGITVNRTFAPNRLDLICILGALVSRCSPENHLSGPGWPRNSVTLRNSFTRDLIDENINQFIFIFAIIFCCISSIICMCHHHFIRTWCSSKWSDDLVFAQNVLPIHVKSCSLILTHFLRSLLPWSGDKKSQLLQLSGNYNEIYFHYRMPKKHHASLSWTRFNSHSKLFLITMSSASETFS